MKRAILLAALVAAGAGCVSGTAGRGPAVGQPAATARPAPASVQPAAAAAGGAAVSAARESGLRQQPAPATPVTAGDLGRGARCTEGPKPDQVICPVGGP